MNITDIQTLAAKANTNAEMSVTLDLEIAYEAYDQLAAQPIDHKATRKEAKAIAAEAAKDLPETEQAAFVTDTYQAIKGHLTMNQLAEVLIPAGREDLIAPIAAVYSI